MIDLGIVDRPVARAHEHGQVADLIRNRADQLRGAGASADDADALALDPNGRVPGRGVHHLALIFFAAGNVGPLPTVYRPMSIDDGVGADHLFRAVLSADGHIPDGLRIVVAQGHDFRVEADVAAKIIFVGDMKQVLLHIDALGVIVRPFRRDFEGIGIEVAGRVDAYAGIAVFIPGTADFGVFLDDDMLIAGLFQLERGCKARHPRADHEDLEVSLRRGAALNLLAGLGELEANLVEEKRQEFVGDFLTHANAHHPLHQLFGRIVFARGSGRGQDMQQL